MIVPYLIGCAWVYDFWRAFRSNCSDVVFAATLLGVLYVPMTSETDQRSRGEVWDEVVARCAMIFVVFFILLMLMNSVKDLVFSDAFVVSPFQKSCCQVCGEFSTFDMTSNCDESSKMAFHGSLVSRPPLCRWWTRKTQNRRPPPLAGPVQLTASSHRNWKDIALPRVQRCSFV